MHTTLLIAHLLVDVKARPRHASTALMAQGTVPNYRTRNMGTSRRTEMASAVQRVHLEIGVRLLRCLSRETPSRSLARQRFLRRKPRGNRLRRYRQCMRCMMMSI